MRAHSALALVCCLIFSLAGFVASTPAQTGHDAVPFSQVTSVSPLANGVELRDGPLVMQITALRDGVLRIRAGRDGKLPEDASWAVLREARSASVEVTQDSNASVAGFHTAALRVAMDRTTGLLMLRDANGTVLRQDAAPLEFGKDGFQVSAAMPSDEHYFGLGDKAGAFDRRQQAFRLWNTDAYAWQESTDPLYKSIPFYLSYRAGTSLGVLIDNTWPSSFDFGRARGDTFQYRAEGGAADIYLLYGPSAKHV